MAKSKALIAAEIKIAALEAQLTLARTCYRALKATTRNCVIVANAAPTTTPAVTRYTDGLGREWIKTRIGNQATSRLAEVSAIN